MTERAMSFYNRRGHKLAGVLSSPDAAEPTDAPPGAPAVLLCQGFSGVKHLCLPEIAKVMAAAGIATLRFDYAGFGESEGEPGWIDPASRIEDARYAFAALAAHDIVDAKRMGIYGHSYGGPVAICLAASERRARAVVATSGPGDGESMLRALRPSWDWVTLRERLEAERAQVAATGKATPVSIEEIMPFSPTFTKAYNDLKAAGVAGTSTMAATDQPPNYFANIDLLLDLHPEEAAARLEDRALLLIHGEDDEVAPVETVAPIYAAAPGPKRWHRVPGAGHIDLDAGPGLAMVAREATTWFLEYLTADPGIPAGR